MTVYTVKPNSPQSNSNVYILQGEVENPIADAEVFVSPIGGALPQFPSDAGELLYVFSTDAADIGLVRISGLDENFEAISETVKLEGLTPVATTSLFTRVNLTEWYDAGGCVGTVDVTDATGIPVFSRVLPEVQQSTDGAISFPANHVAQVLDVYGGVIRTSSAQAVAYVNLYSLQRGQVPRREFRFSVLSNGSSHVDYGNSLPRSSQGHFDLFVTCEVDSAGMGLLTRIASFVEKKL